MGLGKLRILRALLLSVVGGVLLYLPVFGHSHVMAVGFPHLWSTSQELPVHLVANRARKSATKNTKRSPSSPALVRNVRTRAYADYTRVVFDLQRSVTFTQTRRKDPDRAVIVLKDATLGKDAKAKLSDGKFPREVVVSQPHSGTISVSLDLRYLKDYKVLPLSDPPRLVVDIFPQATEGGASTLATGAAGLNGASPTVIVAPRFARPQIRTIIIDPGHGGKDPGAIGRRGTREKDITLKVSLYLRDMIRKRLGKKVLMTRDRDVFIELEERANFANGYDADLFVSIHVNAHPKRGVRGLEVYHFGEASDQRAMEVAARENGIAFDPKRVGAQNIIADKLTDKTVEDSLEFAWTTKRAMVTHLKGRYKIVDHGVKTAPFYVLRFTAMPSILAEIGYMSNSTEERRMKTKGFQRAMATAIFKGIETYIDSVEAAP